MEKIKEKLRILRQKLFGTRKAAIISTIIILFLFSTTVFAAERVMRILAAGCQTSDNLIQNCAMEQISGALPTGWLDVLTDEKRAAGPGQYTQGLQVVTTEDNGKAVAIGRESGTCSLPRTAGGGVDDKLRLFPELRTYAQVGNANKFTLSFDFKMKSRHTRVKSAPFYVWVGFARDEETGRDDQGKGREILLAYTPHDDGEVDQYCSTPFRTDYMCWKGIYGKNRGPVFDCSDAFTSGEHIEVDFDRNWLCETGENGPVDPQCIAKNKELFVGFGVANDYDTLVTVDNVKITAKGGVVPTLPQPTPTTAPKSSQTTSCGVVGNLVKNCNMEQLTNGFPTDWVDGRTSPRGVPGPNSKLTTTKIGGGNAIKIGQEANTCNNKLGPDDDWKIWAETRQDIPVGNGNAFQLTFDLSLKSRTTSPGSSPFYVYSGFEPQKSGVDGKGREIFLAYPTSQGEDQKFCTESFKTSYNCVINGGQQQSCSNISQSPQKFTVNFTRDQVCDNNATCIKENTVLYLSFGVQNDFDTVATVDNVTLTSNTPVNPQPTTTAPTPICGPSTTSAPNVTPNPLACGRVEPFSSDNFLKNGSFGGQTNGNKNNDSMDNIYRDWNTFGDGEFTTGEDNIDGPNILIKDSGNFTDGLYQRVSNLKPGTWYNAFYATAQEIYGTDGKKDEVNGPPPTTRYIGVDPTGGTNPNASAVVWGRTAGGQKDKDAKRYGGWKTLENQNNPLVSFVATGKNATIFLKATGYPNAGATRVWIDSAILLESCDEGNFGSNPLPTCGPTTLPNRTPTPTTRPGFPTPTTKPSVSPTISASPTPLQASTTCSVNISSVNETQKDYNLINISYSGVGGTVELNMGQKGTQGKENGNRYSTFGFFSENNARGIGANDISRKKSKNAGEYNTSTTVYTKPGFGGEPNFTLAPFKIYDWQKQYKKNPSISNTSTTPSDFISGTQTAWWYLISFCNGYSKSCSQNNIQVRIPKNISTFFFCGVRDYTPGKEALKCIGNPICSYNDGPDIGIQPNYACKAWKVSCSPTDFVSFTPNQRGVNVGSFTPTNPIMLEPN